MENDSSRAALRVREYGTSGPLVVAIHGGPGTPGGMAQVARTLADQFRVLEPLQRHSDAEPLTVARHVEDLHKVVETRCGGARPALVAHSWGAMLALAYAAAHPDNVACLALAGCGTFDTASRARLQEIFNERMDDDLRGRMERLPEEFPDEDRRLSAFGDLIGPLFSYDLIPDEDESGVTDARGHREAWDDMMRLQEEGGVYPAAFEAIDAPVMMLHGAYDPHPGEMIRACLERYIPQLEYRQWERCGHYPWLEKAVRQEFFVVLRDWLARQLV